MRVSIAGYRAMARAVTQVADEVCGGRIVCALEGGYHLSGLGNGMVAVLDALDPHSAQGARDARAQSGATPGAHVEAHAPGALSDAAPGDDSGAPARAIMSSARAAIDQTLAARASAGGVPAP
jgi:hypothetical protein